MNKNPKTILPPCLKSGDRVRFVSPVSPAKPGKLDSTINLLEELGLVVEFGKHVYDVDRTIDYLAGKDEDRLSDMSDALRDPGIKAIIATGGGKGAYRIASGLEIKVRDKG